MTLITRLLFNALGLLLIAEYVPGIDVDSLYTAVIAAVVLGALNLFVRPVLFILTLPITIITLGLFAFVINGTLFFFAASFIDDFSVDTYWHALLGSLMMSVVSAVGNMFLKKQSSKTSTIR